MTMAGCGLLVILQIRWNNKAVKIFWNFCPRIKNDARHSIAYCLSATFFAYSCYQSLTGKNSFISSKTELNQFVGGILSGIVFA